MDDPWLVLLGELNHANPATEAVFPTREAAILFAKHNCWQRGAKVLNPELEVIRRYDGDGNRVDKYGVVLRKN